MAKTTQQGIEELQNKTNELLETLIVVEKERLEQFNVNKKHVDDVNKRFMKLGKIAIVILLGSLLYNTIFS